MRGDEIVRPCDRHSNETATLRKHATKYRSMRKWMLEFLQKIENRGIKISRVNSILITKSINLLLFTFCKFCMYFLIILTCIPSVIHVRIIKKNNLLHSCCRNVIDSSTHTYVCVCVSTWNWIHKSIRVAWNVGLW